MVDSHDSLTSNRQLYIPGDHVDVYISNSSRSYDTAWGTRFSGARLPTPNPLVFLLVPASTDRTHRAAGRGMAGPAG